MKKHALAVVLAWLAVTSAAAEDAPKITFERSYFEDFGDAVTVEGQLAKDGGSPDEMSRSVLWCYQERRECLGFLVNASGGVVSILPAQPLIYTVTVWAPDRIVAELHLGCGDRETWLLDRLRRKAEVFGGTCGSNTRADHRTIEDPSSWTKLEKSIEESKHRR